MKTEFIIIGDTDEFKDCLVYLCGTKERAEEVLNKMLTDPSDNDKYMMKGHYNFRIKEVVSEDQWWNEGTLD